MPNAFLCTDGTVFVRVARGIYMRTHPCVLHVACPYCKAPAGMPCKGADLRSNAPTSQTHHKRREALRKISHA